MSFFKRLFGGQGTSDELSGGRRSKTRRIGARISSLVRKKIPRGIKPSKLALKKVNIETVSTHSVWFRWGLLILAIFLASALSSRIIGLFIRPTYTPIPIKRTALAPPKQPTEDYSVIEQRNIFDVENKIPENFDPGFLDCFSQARPSTQRLSLHGTIVMGDESLSVALISEDGNPNKIGVKKDEAFLDKYTLMKVERKKICFQVKQTQELEFIEIPEDRLEMGIAGPTFAGKTVEGIQPVSETNFKVKSTFLESQLNDLNNILQTAKAVQYMEGGKMKGFLVQSIDPDSIFASLGIRQGDVLTGVNGIALDNIGKGVEAFQTFRKASKIELKVMRGGQEVPLNYEVN